MQPYPHTYVVVASGGPEGFLDLRGEGLEPIVTAPPAEFGGPGDRWSPETLFVGAIADCFILTFRAIARASRFEWRTLRCRAEGVLDRVDGVTRFVTVRIQVELEPAEAGREDQARRLLEKAEKGCLITNSLVAEVALETTVRPPG